MDLLRILSKRYRVSIYIYVQYVLVFKTKILNLKRVGIEYWYKKLGNREQYSEMT